MKPQKRKVSIYLDDSMFDAVVRLAVADQRSIAATIERLIRRALSQKGARA